MDITTPLSMLNTTLPPHSRINNQQSIVPSYRSVLFPYRPLPTQSFVIPPYSVQRTLMPLVLSQRTKPTLLAVPYARYPLPCNPCSFPTLILPLFVLLLFGVPLALLPHSLHVKPRDKYNSTLHTYSQKKKPSLTMRHCVFNPFLQHNVYPPNTLSFHLTAPFICSPPTSSPVWAAFNFSLIGPAGQL